MQSLAAPDTAEPHWTLEGERLARSAGLEWLLTNALGGYAMGTIAGTPTRRYHAHLVSATTPPVGRVNVLSALDEVVVLGIDTPQATRVHLTPFQFEVHDKPPPCPPTLVRFERDGVGVRWVHSIMHLGREVRIEKMLHVYDGRNAVRVKYAVRAPGTVVRLEVRPLLRLLDHHRLCEEDERTRFPMQTRRIDAGCVVLRACAGVHLSSHESLFVERPAWWHGVRYERERERGQASLDALFSPGVFEWTTVPASGTSVLTLHASCEATEEPSTLEDAAQSERRIADATRRAIVLAGGDRLSREDLHAIAHLARASDQFVVTRIDQGRRSRSIIAGYPWFSDWGRDAMIALPGLMLITGRLDDARATLETFALHRRDGLIPNRFNDATGHAEYNTADASLLFIKACCELARSEGRGLDGLLLDACLDIVGAYERGTDFEIRLDRDGLIAAGSPATQLTWMDAAHNGVIFTPRFGKPVEINALWHHACLALAAELDERDGVRAAHLRDAARRCAESMRQRFHDERSGCLFDRLEPRGHDWIPIREIRPNQLLAIALEHAPIVGDLAHSVLRTIERDLLTPMGLRTLSPGDPAYKPRYEGDMAQRDGAYHNGTVWPWLIGLYVDAAMKLRPDTPQLRRDLRAALQPLIESMGGSDPRAVAPSTCLGQIAEVFDADDSPEHPRRAGGCPAQAWSVAEVLRALVKIERA